MRKNVLLLVLLLLLASCSSKVELHLEPGEMVSPVKEKFVYESGRCLRDGLYVEYGVLNRGEEIEIVDETTEYYLFESDYVALAVRKEFVRSDKEAPFEAYEGFTRNGAVLYSDYQCNEKLASFKLNDSVKVKDAYLGVLLVEADGVEGYMYPSQVSKTQIAVYVPKPVVPSEPSYSDDGGGSSGSSGGSSSGGSLAPTDPAPAPSSGDGEDITLALNYEVVMLGSESTFKGVVLVDDVKTYLLKLNRDDVLKVLDSDEDYCTILVDGLKARVERKYVRLDSQTSYKSWSAYTKNRSVLYSDYDLDYRLDSFRANEIVEVIDEVDGIYVVKTVEGNIGYMAKTAVSKDKIIIVVSEPKVEAPAVEESSGGSSSSSAPSADPSPAPEPEPEWTKPVL